MKPSAKARVLTALKSAGGRGATTAQLCQPDCGGVRFGGRIKELRDEGYEIETFYVRSGSHRYVLQSGPQAPPALETPETPHEAADSGVLFDMPPRRPKHDQVEAA